MDVSEFTSTVDDPSSIHTMRQLVQIVSDPFQLTYDQRRSRLDDDGFLLDAFKKKRPHRHLSQGTLCLNHFSFGIRYPKRDIAVSCSFGHREDLHECRDGDGGSKEAVPPRKNTDAQHQQGSKGLVPLPGSRGRSLLAG